MISEFGRIIGIYISHLGCDCDILFRCNPAINMSAGLCRGCTNRLGLSNNSRRFVAIFVRQRCRGDKEVARNGIERLEFLRIWPPQSET